MLLSENTSCDSRKVPSLMADRTPSMSLRSTKICKTSETRFNIPDISTVKENKQQRKNFQTSSQTQLAPPSPALIQYCDTLYPKMTSWHTRIYHGNMIMICFVQSMPCKVSF
uniref:Uncharacterized protein n=1 Tax=Gopherus evgoodei TaxID=1825980 RepID=A0A8C4WK45_9SAUR